MKHVPNVEAPVKEPETKPGEPAVEPGFIIDLLFILSLGVELLLYLGRLKYYTIIDNLIECFIFRWSGESGEGVCTEG